MTLTRRAVIDVGTNSVKLLVADVGALGVLPVLEESRQTRLGAGFFATHRLDPARIRETAEAVGSFARRATQQKAEHTLVIATSAARDALNQHELLEAIERASGLSVKVISGEQEARWAFEGATTDPGYANIPLLLVDVGGGSTEFIFGQRGRMEFAYSFRLGTVRLMDRVPCGDPPSKQELHAAQTWLDRLFQKEIEPAVAPALKQAPETVPSGSRAQLVATGGSAAILGCMELELSRFDRAALEKVRISLERLRRQEERLWSLPIEERKRIRGLPPNRADVILSGASIHRAIAERLGFPELRISTRGLRFAAVAASSPGR